MIIIFLFSCGENLTISESIIDFGEVKPESKHEKFLTIYNRGWSDVEIDTVLTPCTCTKVEVEKYIIESNDSTELYLNFESRSRSGKMKKDFTIKFKNGKSIKAYITCKVNSIF